MANNYVYHSETINEEEGACALEPRLEQLANMQGSPMENDSEQLQLQQQQQQQQQLQLQQQHQQQQQLQQQQLQQQQVEMQQFDPTIVHLQAGPGGVEVVVQEPTTLGATLNVQSSKAYTSIAVQGQKIKSKLNPLAPEFYPSYKRIPKNGYVINPPLQQMPNAAAMAAAATAAQYGYLDYDCGYADWPTYEYDVARYMDYERFMTSHMQRSNTAVTLVRNNYSGSGSAAPPSGSTSFQDQPSYENLRQKRSFNRSFSGTSYNFRKHHKSSKEVSRENMRSWYIDKKAEEKRMESWKNISAEAAYQDNIPVTSSKDEFFELLSPNSEVKESEKLEKHVDEYQRPNSPSPPLPPPPPIEDAKSQRHATRTAGGTTESTPRKIKSQRKLRKENTEMSKKKLIMLYPSKRNVNDLLQSSQDSMFTQPNPIEYTSDESFLTQLSSSQLMDSEIDKILNEVKEKENQMIENKNKSQTVEAENTDSLEDFEMTTKPSEPKILESSKSVSPVSVIEQEKPRKTEKIVKPYLEPRTAVNRPKKESERTTHKPSRKPNKQTLSTGAAQKSIVDPTILENELMQYTDLEPLGVREKQTTHVAKEPKTIIVPKGKYFVTPSDSSRDESKTSQKRTAHGAGECETPKTAHKSSRGTAGAESTGVSKPAVYTGAIPKTKERDAVKHKEIAKEMTQPSQPNVLTTTTSKSIGKSSTGGAMSKARDASASHHRKLPSSSGEVATAKISRGSTQKTNASSATQKDDKSKVEHWIQRPPNGIVANRVQIFANSSKSAAAAKSETQPDSTSHKRLTSKTQTSGEKRTSKTASELTTQKQSTLTGGSILKKSTALTAVGPSAATAAPALTDKRSAIQKSIIKTQMRTAAANQETTHNSSKKLSSTHSPLTPKKESAESKKSKSIVAGSSRNALATSSKSIKTGSTKIPLREKSSSLRGVKAVIGSDGDKNAAKVKSSRSCISLRPAPKALVKKPSATSTKVSKKSPSTAVHHKKHSEALPPASTLRTLQMEKRRNPYSDPGADYKIVQSTFLHK